MCEFSLKMECVRLASHDFDLDSAQQLLTSRVNPISSGDKSAIGRVIVPMSYVIGGLPSGVSSRRIVHLVGVALQCHDADYLTPAPPPTYIPLPSLRRTHSPIKQ
jgi:hypothetical protein